MSRETSPGLAPPHSSRFPIFFLIDLGKLAQNGKVERSHRTDQECL